MKLFRRIRLTQKTIDILFDYFMLITSIATLIFVVISILPIIIFLPEYWLRPFLELLFLGYLGIRGLLLWKKEVE